MLPESSHKYCFWALAEGRSVRYALRDWSLVEFLSCAVPSRCLQINCRQVLESGKMTYAQRSDVTGLESHSESNASAMTEATVEYSN